MLRTWRLPALLARRFSTLGQEIDLGAADVIYSHYPNGPVFPSSATESDIIDLIKERKHASAHRLYFEVIANDRPPRQNAIYVQLAEYFLDFPQDSTNRDDNILLWISLLPDMHNSLGERIPSSEQPDLTAFRRALLETGNPLGEIPLVTRLAIMLASKGLSDAFRKPAASLLSLCKDRNIAADFFAELETAEISYLLRKKPSDIDHERVIRELYTGLAVRMCCAHNWWDQTLRLLRQAARKGTPTVDVQTCVFVLSALMHLNPQHRPKDYETVNPSDRDSLPPEVYSWPKVRDWPPPEIINLMDEVLEHIESQRKLKLRTKYLHGTSNDSGTRRRFSTRVDSSRDRWDLALYPVVPCLSTSSSKRTAGMDPTSTPHRSPEVAGFETSKLSSP